MTNYADAPVSIAELRARKSGNGKDWTPRDALVETLRRIDSGEINPDFAVITFGRETKPGNVDCSYVQATPNMLVALGLLSSAAMMLNAHGSCDHE